MQWIYRHVELANTYQIISEVKMRDNRIVIGGIVFVVLIAGVLIVFLGGRNNTGGSDILSVPEVITQDGTSNIVQETAVDVAVSATVTVQSNQVVPTQRIGLEATDPGSVNLMTGNVQFIEAFAFW